MRKTIAIGSAALASLALVALPTSSALASKARVAADVPPGEVTVNLVAANGSGCPAGSAVITLQPDKKAFKVSRLTYGALVGVGAGPLDFRKNCQLGVRLHIPQGYSFAVASAAHHGFASIQKGASAVVGANYYFSGEPQTTVIKHNIPGPLEDPWVTHDKVPFASLEWSRCGGGRDLNINTSLLLNEGTSDTAHTTSIITIGGDLDPSATYQLTWKACGT